MSLQNLPTGANFRLRAGAGNFAQKLGQTTRASSWRHLRDRQKSIVQALSPMEKLIRQGKFGRLERSSALKKIKALEGGSLTTIEKRDIKKILSHVGQSPAKIAGKSSVQPGSGADQSGERVEQKPKVAAKTVSEKRAVIKRNLARLAADEAAALRGQSRAATPATGLRASAQRVPTSAPPTASGFRAAGNRRMPL